MTAEAPAYRTHLFSDLRGYTTLLEQAGNTAGAEMLIRYRAMVRSVIGRFGGTEVSTEGDAFYVVFSSASNAVLCGLAIVEEAALENQAHTEVPIKIGVGIHSGEAVETDSTFVGTAVNVAARVCAVAQSGEVLVTSTVRGIVHGNVAATFHSRGKKKLKGLAEPIELFSVVEAGRPVPAAQRLPLRRALVLAAVGGAVVIGLGAATAFWPPPREPAATPGPTDLPTAIVGPLGLGSYQSERFTPKIRFDVSDLGWSVYRSNSDAVGLLYQFEPQGKLDIGRPGRVFVDPCATEGASVPVGRTAAEFFEAAAQAPYLHVAEPTTTAVGGQQALTADISLDPGAQAACGSLGGAGSGSGISVFSLGGEFWSAQPGETVRVVALDSVDGLITMLVSNTEASATSVQSLEDFFNLADRIVQSLRF
jgi:class 3 adenylate cyclase